MTLRDLNNPDQHDGTGIELDFGGPYHLYLSKNGDTIIREEVGKSDQLYVAIAPLGETAEGETDE